MVQQSHPLIILKSNKQGHIYYVSPDTTSFEQYSLTAIGFIILRVQLSVVLGRYVTDVMLEYGWDQMPLNQHLSLRG